MGHFQSKRQLLESLLQNIERLEAGELSLQELEAHTDMVRDLYERTIVLRFKAFERQVKPLESADQEKVSVARMDEEVEISEEKSVEEEISEEKPDFTQRSFSNSSDLPIIDFSLFDDVEPAAEVEEKIVEAPFLKSEELEEIITQKVEEEVMKPVLKEVDEVREEIASIQTPPAQSNDSISDALNKKFKTIEQEIRGQLGFSKLDSLVGSFGLNERLQYINELFDGSSEHFSNAVKTYDSLSSLEEAKLKTGVFSQENKWDLESETVDEFIQKLYRRYA